MRALIALTLAAVALAGADRSAEPFPAADSRVLQDLIKPSPGEDKWVEIPWGTSLWDARKQSARLGKPILLWEMDGHPLGCT